MYEDGVLVIGQFVSVRDVDLDEGTGEGVLTVSVVATHGTLGLTWHEEGTQESVSAFETSGLDNDGLSGLFFLEVK